MKFLRWLEVKPLRLSTIRKRYMNIIKNEFPQVFRGQAVATHYHKKKIYKYNQNEVPQVFRKKIYNYT